MTARSSPTLCTTSTCTSTPTAAPPHNKTHRCTPPHTQYCRAVDQCQPWELATERFPTCRQCVITTAGAITPPLFTNMHTCVAVLHQHAQQRGQCGAWAPLVVAADGNVDGMCVGGCFLEGRGCFWGCFDCSVLVLLVGFLFALFLWFSLCVCGIACCSVYMYSTQDIQQLFTPVPLYPCTLVPTIHHSPHPHPTPATGPCSSLNGRARDLCQVIAHSYWDLVELGHLTPSVSGYQVHCMQVMHTLPQAGNPYRCVLLLWWWW